MKNILIKKHFLITCLALGLILSIEFAECQTVSTPIVGFSKVTAPAGTIVVVPSFVKPNLYQGTSTLSGQVFSCSSFTAGQLAPTTYTDGRPNYPTSYVEIVSGPYEGTVMDIQSNTTSSVTVTGAPTILNGQSVSIAIRRHITLDDLVVGASGLQDYSDGATVFNSDGSSSIRYFASGSWVADDYSTPAGQTVVYPGQGLTLSSAGASLILNGNVKTTKTLVPLYAGVINLVGPGNPSGNTNLENLNIASALDPYNDGINSFSANGEMTIAETYFSDGSGILDSSYSPIGSPAYVGVNSGFVVSVGSSKYWTVPSTLNQ